jgi:hypothetical protein
MDDLKITPEKARALGRSDVHLPGSLRLTPEQLLPRAPQWPRGASVIAYCT